MKLLFNAQLREVLPPTLYLQFVTTAIPADISLLRLLQPLLIIQPVPTADKLFHEIVIRAKQ